MVGNGSIWGTKNELTCSGGNSSAPYSYNKTSGTIPANSRSRYSHGDGGNFLSNKSEGHTDGQAEIWNDRQNTGKNAALIRTVGWCNGASGNTASSAGRTCNNKTPGELYLGTYVGDETTGYPMSSRPSGVSFYYHYDVKSPQNGDYGTVYVEVLDADDKPIASGKKELTECPAYKPESVPLTYTYNANKAKTIKVVFKSSENPSALELNKNFWDYPKDTNLSGGEYVGSELYIDDIELIY